jgi:hypothetical protein
METGFATERVDGNTENSRIPLREAEVYSAITRMNWETPEESGSLFNRPSQSLPFQGTTLSTRGSRVGHR